MSAAIDSISIDKIKKRIAQGATSAFFIYVFSAALAFLSQVVLARTLGPDEYGIYAYAFAWITILGLLATLGFKVALLRLVPAYLAKKQWSQLRGAICYSRRLVLLAGLAIALVGAALVWNFDHAVEPALAKTLLVGLAIVPLLALLRIYSSIVRGFGKVTAALLPELAIREIVMLIIIGTLLLTVSVDLEPADAMLATLGGVTLALVAVLFSYRRERPLEYLRAEAAAPQKEWLITALILLLSTGAALMRENSGVLVFGWLGNTTDAGIYAAVWRVTLVCDMPLVVLNTVFAPMVSSLHAKGEKRLLQESIKTSAYWTVATACLIATPFILLPTFWLGFFGDEFHAGANALRILLVGRIISAIFNPFTLMTMIGQEREISFVTCAQMFCQIVLFFALIPLFGLEGAAMVQVTVTLVGNVACALLIWKKERIMTGILSGVKAIT